jgi:hypothetical protein
MAHVEDVYTDPAGRFSVSAQTCPEVLTGWFGQCEKPWCVKRDHCWYAVTRIDADGYGEDVGEVFDFELDALEWAEIHFGSMQGA